MKLNLKKNKILKFKNEVNNFNDILIKKNFNYNYQAEYFVESSFDYSLFYDLNQIKTWFKKIRKKNLMKTKYIPLEKMNNWKKNDKGDYYHESKQFFKVHGIRTFTKIRETNENFWDQPFITQIGYDGGILGLIRKRFSGIPHYLCEAKFEPGNYGCAQLSPTIQATFSNLNAVHKGRKPYFFEYFDKNNIKKYNILFNAWTAEDGGRLFNKRNKSILIELSNNIKISLPNNYFIWLSLYQIKALLKENAWINPHLRGIIAHT
jgi:dTDP-4-dehydro-6-deoxy-alpha-D-glucopyranose 2,3-dehydratase